MDKKPLKKLEHKTNVKKLLVYVGIGLGAVIVLFLISRTLSTTIHTPWSSTGNEVQMAMPGVDVGVMEDEMMSSKRMVNPKMAPGVVPPVNTPSGETYEGERKIIKNTSLNLLVTEVDPVVTEIKSITANYEGFIGSLNISDYDQVTANITVYIPEDKVEIAVSEFKKLAVIVRSENTSGYDVTEQFIDLDSRIRNLKREEEQYLKILGNAVKTEDILKIEQQLSRVRREIERNESSKKSLENQTSLSAVSISLEEEKSATAIKEGEWRPLTNLKIELKKFVQSLQGFVDYLVSFIFFLIAAIPYLIFYTIVLIIVGLVLKFVWKIVKKVVNK